MCCTPFPTCLFEISRIRFPTSAACVIELRLFPRQSKPPGKEGPFSDIIRPRAAYGRQIKPTSQHESNAQCRADPGTVSVDGETWGLSWATNGWSRNKAIIAYLNSVGHPDAAQVLRSELSLGEDVFDQQTTKRYEGFLEKKWTGIVRLQKKVRSTSTNRTNLRPSLSASYLFSSLTQGALF